MDTVRECKTSRCGPTGAARCTFITVLIAAAGLLFGSCGRVHEEYANGQGDAERDAAKGMFNVAYGNDQIEPANGEYADLLRKRYNIGIRGYSLPAKPKAAEAAARGYNNVMMPLIERKFGTNVLEQTMAEARRLHAASTTNRLAPQHL
jgi:hypothetical protein